MILVEVRLNHAGRWAQVICQNDDVNLIKAIGPDLLPTRILKEYCGDIAPILTLILQQSLDSGVVPKDWKTANVVALYKKGDRHSASNYRPVSLTCIS